MRLRTIALIGSALLLISGCGGGTTPATTPQRPSSAPLAPVRSLPARWWIWTESFGPSANPIDDPTGASCAVNQPADVWFLAGSHGGAKTRHCHIPAGRAIYFPVIDQICTAQPGAEAAAAVKACSVSVVKAEASLDGTPLHVAEADSGGIFPFGARPGSSTGFVAGLNQAVAWGLWVGPVRVRVGHHTLRFKGQSGTFELDITYKLNVG